MSLKKVRRVVKAQQGLSTPLIGNPYNITNGLSTPLPDSLSPLNTGSPTGRGPNITGLNTAGQIIGLANSLLFGNQQLNNSALTTGLNTAWDTGANIVSKANPVVGLAMKAGSLVSNAAKALGTGTDLLTGFDKFSDSTIGLLTGIGMINGAFGKRSRDFSSNKATIEQVGGSYGGTVKDISKAEDMAGKKYGAFSRRKRKKADRFIGNVESLQNIMTDIAKEASDLSSIATNMSDLNHLRYGTSLNGGYDLRYARAAKFGAKLLRIKKINFHKLGGLIKDTVNLDDWQPTIESKWTPIITLLEGGKTEKVDDPKVTFLSWYDTVPKDRLSNNYDLEKAFEVLPFEELEAWRRSSDEDLRIGKNHLRSIYLLPNGDYEFLKLGNELSNPEVHFETDTYHSGENGLKDSHDLVFEKDRYFYRKKQFKNGGKLIDTPEETNLKNVIPEGALHAHKHHMENDDNITKKGIPVIDNDGELLAEIEREEWIMTLELTKFIEERYKKFYSEEVSNNEKEELAKEAGKELVYLILKNTEDRANLISTLKLGGVIYEPK